MNTCQTCRHFRIEHDGKKLCKLHTKGKAEVKPSRISHCDRWHGKEKV